MKKEISYLVICLLCFFTVSNVYAEDKGGFINTDGVSFRSEANEKGKEVLTTLDTGDYVTLLDDNMIKSDSNKCETGYYYANFYFESRGKNYKGYVCSDYLTFNVDTSKYATIFANAGFPESYFEKLTLLKDSHPNWIFTAYKTNIKWSDALDAETVVGPGGGISYIQSSNPIYLSLDEGSYNPTTKTYNEMEKGGWYAANRATVAYYMDPRNFLDQVNIFQFENLGYNSSYQTESVIENIFKNTELLPYTKYFMEAATFDGNNVSPVMLAARSKQEVVKSDGKLSNSANGQEYNGTKVYNFYNLGAFSSCANPVQCAIEFAGGYEGKYLSYNRPWKTPEEAIKNGAKYLAEGYINEKQNTLYFNKWNVTNNKYGNFSHQYMTNIAAPSSEGKSTYSSYSKIDGLLNSPIEFIIPVYDEMPNEASKKPVTVDTDKKNELDHNATVKKEISAIVNSGGYIYNTGYISGIRLNTSANEMITNLLKDNPGVTVTIKNNDSNVIVGDEKLGTGYIITINNGEVEETFRIVIYGDVNGDSKITAVDYVRIKNYIMGSGSLEGAYRLAADVNNDNNVSAVDYVNIKNYIMGGNTVIK